MLHCPASKTLMLQQHWHLKVLLLWPAFLWLAQGLTQHSGAGAP
jgi:hypothetical protein